MNNQRYYDGKAANFACRESHTYHRFLNDLTAEILTEWLPSGSVLDAGCGTGHLAKRLSNTSRTVTGLDLSLNMLLNGRSNSIPAGTGGNNAPAVVGVDTNARVVQASIDAIPFCAKTFDGAISMRVFPHLLDPAGALAELARVVRPGGIIVLDVYNPVSLRYCVKQIQGVGKRGELHELFTRYDTIRSVRHWLPKELRYTGYRGIRVITPVGRMQEWRGMGNGIHSLERTCTKSCLGIFGGFLMIRLERIA